MMNKRNWKLLTLAVVCGIALNVRAADDAATLPVPDGKPADMTKPVKVFILLGQSNMLGFGKVVGDKDGTLEHAVKTKKLYPFLVDAEGKWTVRNDVRNVRVMVGRGGGAMGIHNNEWLTIGKGNIGPEIGIGHHVGNTLTEPVMILKSCIGNRSLGWDLLPPGSKGFETEEVDKKTGVKKTFVYAGYKQTPMKWEKGTTPKDVNWYAGKQYDDDIANAKKVLADLEKFYPGAKGYEVAGFFWWQGDKDRYDAGLAGRYEQNLVTLIETLRKDFNAPKAPFVCATLGQTKKGDEGNEGLILNAMMAVDGNSGKYPQFKGNVATVYTNPLSKGGASNGHYGGNAETYMNVGLSMGKAMADLLKGGK
ncbi:MAG: sialate O-acetylesterase [Zavarzinella sp.]